MRALGNGTMGGSAGEQDLGFEASAAINYDWYHPQLCSRHTRDEVRGWFEEAGLAVVHEHVDPYGITMRGRAPAVRN